MNARERKERIARFEARCRERGLPMTAQRRVVMEELLASREHPTAEAIRERAARRVPGISLTTVYRVLDLLGDLGLARKTSSPGGACRYDPRLDRHHHLVCMSCDRITDLEDPALNLLPLPKRRRTGYEIVDYTVQFRGTCSRCLSRRPGKSASKI